MLERIERFIPQLNNILEANNEEPAKPKRVRAAPRSADVAEGEPAPKARR